MTPEAEKALTYEQRAEDIVDAWEHFEGETMCDGHRVTMEKLIAGQMREVAEQARREADEECAKRGHLTATDLKKLQDEARRDEAAEWEYIVGVVCTEADIDEILRRAKP